MNKENVTSPENLPCADGQPTSAPADTSAAGQASTDPSAAQEPIHWPDDLSVSPQAQTAFLETVRTLRLSAQQAQTLVDLEARLTRENAQEQTRRQQEQVRRWGEEVQQVYGPQWEEAISLAVRAADRFGGPALRALLEDTGLGNHPVIVRTFNEIGKRISEDFSAGGSESSGADKTFAEALYGTMKKGE